MYEEATAVVLAETTRPGLTAGPARGWGRRWDWQVFRSRAK